MIHRSGRRVSILLAVVLVGSLVAAAVAIAASFPRPALKSPGNGKRVHAGHIVLRATVHLPASEHALYAAIGPTRKAVTRQIQLKGAPKGCNGKCTFIRFRQVKPGVFTYRAQFSFPGVWNETPGKYFWQAEYTAPLCQAPHCEVVSAMHSFRVVK
ncbi:MAG TPA: hypothetical protein VE571_11050 [Solirubrobacteraceae bacterium]|nr:hypothetical protein [Solirubrobacteraceae bacterium]